MEHEKYLSSDCSPQIEILNLTGQFRHVIILFLPNLTGQGIGKIMTCLQYYCHSQTVR
jgi:hypothetical protein